MKRRADEQSERAEEAGCHEAEDIFADADDEGFDESSPERVTDDEIFREQYFEIIQRTR